jgi:hypothetical protein
MNTWLLDTGSAEQLGVFVGRYRMGPEKRQILLEAAGILAQRRWRSTMEHLRQYRNQSLPRELEEALQRYEANTDQTLYLTPYDVRAAYEEMFGQHDLKETEQT